MRGTDAITIKLRSCVKSVNKFLKCPEEAFVSSLGCEMSIGSCVSSWWLCHATGVSFWKRCERVMERGHFQPIKTLFLLSSSHKDIIWLQKTWNATRLFVMLVYCLFYGQFCNKYLWLYFYLLLHVLYCSEVGRGGVRCSNESINLYKIISIFFFTNACKPLN